MKTKVSNPKVAAQIVEILKEKSVDASVADGHVVVEKNVQVGLDTFPFRDWFKTQHDDCDCMSCQPYTY